MRYALIREMDISNGEGIGVSLFVQGCHIHCKGCFNHEIWDFNGGKEWNEEIENKFFELIDRPFVKRVSFLGGEPLANENIFEVYYLCEKIKHKFPEKNIWLYTGYKLSINNFKPPYLDLIVPNEVVKLCDVIVDGPYIEEQRDLTLAFRGSTNQRIIDVKNTIAQGEIVLWNGSEN